MKVISFSLYGSIPKYCVGAIKNVQLADKYFPDFICFIYIDDSVPLKYLNELNSYTNVKIIKVLNNIIPDRMWRYLAIDESSVDCMISRDVDSRLSLRESQIVHDWLQRGELFINIKDNPLFHKTPKMLAGMWGMKKIENFNMVEIISYWLHQKQIIDFSKVDLDQQFLSDIIYPQFNTDMAYYDNFNLNNIDTCIKIPFKRKGYRYIGEIFNEFDKPDVHWRAIRDHQLKNYGYIGRKITAFLWKLKKL